MLVFYVTNVIDRDILKMKNDRKDIFKTRDKGRTLVSKSGVESPRSAKAYWNLWKIARKSSPDELRYLIFERKRQIFFTDKEDYEKIKRLRGEIKLLTDAYRIIKRKQPKAVEFEDKLGDFPMSMGYNLSDEGISLLMSDHSVLNAYFNENESGVILESNGEILDVNFGFEFRDDGSFAYDEPIYSSQKHVYKGWEYHKNI
jgi:hypothetical protein